MTLLKPIIFTFILEKSVSQNLVIYKRSRYFLENLSNIVTDADYRSEVDKLFVCLKNMIR